MPSRRLGAILNHKMPLLLIAGVIGAGLVAYAFLQQQAAAQNGGGGFDRTPKPDAPEPQPVPNVPITVPIVLAPTTRLPPGSPPGYVPVPVGRPIALIEGDELIVRAPVVSRVMQGDLGARTVGPLEAINASLLNHGVVLQQRGVLDEGGLITLNALRAFVYGPVRFVTGEIVTRTQPSGVRSVPQVPAPGIEIVALQRRS